MSDCEDRTRSEDKSQSPLLNEFHKFRADLTPFSRLEEDQILAWILKYKAFSLLGTDTIWMRMEKLEVFQGRPWNSLKEHFMEYIVPNLCQFNISHREKLKIEAYMSDVDVINVLEDTDIEGESDNLEVEFKIKRFRKEIIPKDVAGSSDENLYVARRSRRKSKTKKYSKVPAEEIFNPSDASESIVERCHSSLSGASDEEDDDHENDGRNPDISILRSSTSSGHSSGCSKRPEHSMDSDTTTTGFGASSSKVHAVNVGPGHVTKRSQEFGSTAPASSSIQARHADDGARAAAGSGILPVVTNSSDEPATGSDNIADADVSFESLSTEVSAANVIPPASIDYELDFQEVPTTSQVVEDILNVEDAPDVEDVLDASASVEDILDNLDEDFLDNLDEDFLDNPVEDVDVEGVPIENIPDVPNEEVPAPAGPIAPRRSTRTRRPPARLLVDFRAGKIYKSAR